MQIKEITPKHLLCGIGACPAVFETGKGTVLVVARQLRPEEIAETNLESRINADETAVEIPREYLEGLK